MNLSSFLTASHLNNLILSLVVSNSFIVTKNDAIFSHHFSLSNCMSSKYSKLPSDGRSVCWFWCCGFFCSLFGWKFYFSVCSQFEVDTCLFSTLLTHMHVAHMCFDDGHCQWKYNAIAQSIIVILSLSFFHPFEFHTT